jgi:hypothetical protein
MTCRLQGTYRNWSCKSDEYGYRDYSIVFEVISDDPADGPQTVLNCPGLPTVGSTWLFGNDDDIYVYAKLVQEATPRVKDEACLIWDVSFSYSSRPDLQKCETLQFTDPLLQCPKISGHSTKRTIEATLDIGNHPIVNSAFEQIRGPNNEWDNARTGVRVELNTNSTGVLQAIQFLDYVNIAPLWGYDARCIKLSTVTWEKKYYGACSVYFSLIMEFDIANFEPGLSPLTPSPNGIPPGSWDRLVQDEGTKVLNGHYNRETGTYQLLPVGGIPNPTNSPELTAVIPGGSLADGTYYYKYTAVDALGKETQAGPPISVTISGGGGAGAVSMFLTLVPGAASYNIYGRPSTIGGTYDLLGSTETGMATPFFFDDGSGAIGGPPPSTNMTLVQPNPLNPQHFIQYKDPNNNVCKVMLNGAGLPADVFTNTGSSTGTITGPGHILVQYYLDGDFTLLGVPTSFTGSCTDTAP